MNYKELLESIGGDAWMLTKGVDSHIPDIQYKEYVQGEMKLMKLSVDDKIIAMEVLPHEINDQEETRGRYIKWIMMAGIQAVLNNKVKIETLEVI